MTPSRRLPDPIGVYAILDAGVLAPADLPDAARRLAAAGVRTFQVRAKALAAGAFVTLVRDVRAALPPDAVLLVNDRVDVALATAADGVHLGDMDLPVGAARALLGPDAIVGYSTHSPDQARDASGPACDYVGFGPMFTTTTKVTGRPTLGVEGLAAACRVARVPVVAIGGIGVDSLAAIRGAGASGAAMISALLVPGRIDRVAADAVAAWARGTAPATEDACQRPR